jgi:hypothetical protein
MLNLLDNPILKDIWYDFVYVSSVIVYVYFPCRKKTTKINIFYFPTEISFFSFQFVLSYAQIECYRLQNLIGITNMFQIYIRMF